MAKWMNFVRIPLQFWIPRNVFIVNFFYVQLTFGHISNFNLKNFIFKCGDKNIFVSLEFISSRGDALMRDEVDENANNNKFRIPKWYHAQIFIFYYISWLSSVKVHSSIISTPSKSITMMECRSAYSTGYSSRWLAIQSVVVLMAYHWTYKV